MRGRKPTPTGQKLLAGNPGHRPINTEEPVIPPAPPSFDDPPPAVAEHSAAAAAEWRRLAPILRASRTVTETDRAALMALCMEWAEYLDASAKVRVMGAVIKSPTGFPIQNPYVWMKNKCLAACTKLWPELGLTPASRSRVKAATDSGGTIDPFDEFDAPSANATH